ncbi:hypothetical protein TNCV_4803901 [Trichonephila clavipes]|nr:hypothetical protein TNCV_4803901 [Trichonephila clavipes]
MQLSKQSNDKSRSFTPSGHFVPNPHSQDKPWPKVLYVQAPCTHIHTQDFYPSRLSRRGGRIDSGGGGGGLTCPRGVVPCHKSHGSRKRNPMEMPRDCCSGP